MMKPKRPLSALSIRMRSGGHTPDSLDRFLESESDLGTTSARSVNERRFIKNGSAGSGTQQRMSAECGSQGCHSERFSPTVAHLPFRSRRGFLETGVLEDSFNEFLEEYAQLIKVEGQKALGLAKSKITVEVNQAYEGKLLDLRNKISEGENIIKDMEREVEQKRELTKRVHKQLINVSRLCGSNKGNELLRVLTKGGDGNSKRLLIEKWRSKAKAKKLERDGARVYVAFYMFRFAFRVWSSWRVSAQREKINSSFSDKFKIIKSDKEKIVEAFHKERETAQAELNSLKEQLAQEVKKREDMMIHIRDLFQAKIEGLSTEVIDAIEHSREIPQMAPCGLPFVKCDAVSAPIAKKPPPARPMSASSRKNLKN